MDFRRGTTFAAVVTACLGMALVTPAYAGVGWSTYCNDGQNADERQVISSPISLGVEREDNPAGVSYVMLCFSTTPYGAPSGVGGAVQVRYRLDGSASPVVEAGIACHPDSNAVLWPSCDLAATLAVAPGDAPGATAPPTGICLVNVNGACAAYAPGLRLATGQDGRDTAAVTILGVPLAANIPAQCVAILVPC